MEIREFSNSSLTFLPQMRSNLMVSKSRLCVLPEILVLIQTKIELELLRANISFLSSSTFRT